MFNNSELTRVLVAERQETLRNEASQHRLVRAARRARNDARSLRPARLVDPLPAVEMPPEERVAA